MVKDAVPNSAAGLRVHGFVRSGSRSMTTPKRPPTRDLVHGLGERFGEKTVTESAVSGWTLTDITCSEGSDRARRRRSVDPGDDDHVHVHEHEGREGHDRQGRGPERRAGLRVHGNVRRRSPSTMTLTATLRTRRRSRSRARLRSEDGDGVGGRGLVVTEITCSEGTDRARRRVQVDPGDDDHVHVHEQEGREGHDRQGRMPNSAQDFGFTTTGRSNAFSLDDDGDVTLSNTKTFTSRAATSVEDGDRVCGRPAGR